MQSFLKYANLAWVKSEHGEQLIKLSTDILDSWSAEHRSPPESLYHYTTTEGLLGVLKSNRLWATEVSYFNDPNEIHYADDLIKKQLQARSTSVSSEVTQEFIRLATASHNPFDGFRTFYAVCFCQKEDLLSQWRAYSNRGGGYAIGFATKDMVLRWNPPPEFSLRKIIYKQGVQNNFIARTLNNTISLLEKVTSGQTKTEAIKTIAIFLSFLHDHLAEYLISFKNPAFEEEHEWRAILQIFLGQNANQERIRFRSAQGILVPYIELDLSPAVGPSKDKVPISSITIGPTVQPQELAKKSIELFLKKQQLDFALVRYSGIPLR